MNDIKLLDKNTIDKIAAGEVVDRPASIVKELVENAIDAGSKAVSIEIRNGGKSLIRITDNGSGIRADQVKTAFLRHSTSKISDASDLAFIHTLGFRGEALSSIAAVSRVQLYTKTSDEVTGVIFRINGGMEESFEEAGLPDGTTIIIRDLFYNTPARLKFLKSDTTEGNYIMDVVQRIALSKPDISFKFTSNGAVKLATPGNGSLKDTVYSIFGRDITANLLDIDDAIGSIRIKGFIGKPEIARGNRNFEIYFVNGRYIRDKVVQKAVEDAYTGYQMKGTFPFALLNIEIETELVDVNVHPSKMEIRFYDNEEVFNSIYEIIRKRVTKRQSIPEVSLQKDKDASITPDREKVYIPEPFEVRKSQKQHEIFEKSGRFNDHDAGNTYNRLTENQRSSTQEQLEDIRDLITGEEYEDLIQNGDDNMPPADKSESAAIWASEQSEPVQVSYEQASLDIPEFLSEEARKEHRIIGEVFDTYWIVEYDQKLFIIDQHAAHEKVLYERFMKQLREGVHYSQQIAPRQVITLSRQEADILENNIELFRNLGFELEHFGGSEYAVSAVPTDLYGIDNKIVLVQMINDLAENSARTGARIMTDRIATAACKAAVKGGNRLSFAEADRLIEELLGLENPYNCPHGRPTIISMSKYELEKKFKRVI